MGCQAGGRLASISLGGCRGIPLGFNGEKIIQKVQNIFNQALVLTYPFKCSGQFIKFKWAGPPSHG